MFEVESNQSIVLQRLGVIAGTVFTVVFGLMSIFNVVVAIKSWINPYEPPKVCETLPIISQTTLKSGEETLIKSGDLMFISTSNILQLSEDTVVVFEENKALYVGRVTQIVDENTIMVDTCDERGTEHLLKFDSEVVGRCTFAVHGVGDFALFTQRPLGFILLIVLPLVLFAWYVLSRKDEKCAPQSPNAIPVPTHREQKTDEFWPGGNDDFCRKQ